MAKHKIVAYRLTGTPEGVKLEALTESPRGTRIPFEHTSVKLSKTDREANRIALEQAFVALTADKE